jgi:hypothetical protein
METIYKVGDRVVFTSQEEHDSLPSFYPEAGTSGVVLEVETNFVFVEWEDGSTSSNDKWWANFEDIELLEIANP